MGLKKYIKPRIRKQLEDVIIYNPTKEEREQIRQILQDFINLGNVNGNIESKVNINSISIEKQILGIITNQKEELDSMSDDEYINMIQSGHEYVEEIKNEMKLIIEECLKELRRVINDELDMLINLFDQKQDFEPESEKLKILASKLNMSVDDLIALSQKQNELNELQKKLPTPQDHLPKQQSKKRGRPKKADKVVEKVEEVKEGEINA